MSSRLARIALAAMIASEMGEWESTITWAFHSASVCVGIGYLNIETRRGLAVVGATYAGGMRRGNETLPSTP